MPPTCFSWETSPSRPGGVALGVKAQTVDTTRISASCGMNRSLIALATVVINDLLHKWLLSICHLLLEPSWGAGVITSVFTVLCPMRGTASGPPQAFYQYLLHSRNQLRSKICECHVWYWESLNWATSAKHVFTPQIGNPQDMRLLFCRHNPSLWLPRIILLHLTAITIAIVRTLTSFFGSIIHKVEVPSYPRAEPPFSQLKAFGQGLLVSFGPSVNTTDWLGWFRGGSVYHYPDIKCMACKPRRRSSSLSRRLPRPASPKPRREPSMKQEFRKCLLVESGQSIRKDNDGRKNINGDDRDDILLSLCLRSHPRRQNLESVQGRVLGDFSSKVNHIFLKQEGRIQRDECCTSSGK